MNNLVHSKQPGTRQAKCGVTEVKFAPMSSAVTCPRCRMAGSPLQFFTVSLWGGHNFCNELRNRATNETLVNSLVFSNRRNAAAALDDLLAAALGTNPYIRQMAEEHYDENRGDWFN